MTDLAPRPGDPGPLQSRAGTGIDRAILVHASQSKVSEIAPFSRHRGISVIYTVAGGKKIAAADRLLAQHQTIVGPDAQILFDSNRYSGKNRAFATEPLSADWVRWQLGHGAPVALTDTGFLSLERLDDVDLVLGRTAEIAGMVTGQVMAVLPIDYLILKERPDRLRAAIDAAGVPVALAVGHSGDPFSSHDTVRGLLHVLATSVDTALLRSDLSAVAAVAAGARFGAVGTSSTLRHIWPPKGGGPTQPGASVLVPRLMSYHRLERLAPVAAQVPADHFWCFCEICQGRAVFDHVSDRTAHEHSIGAIAAIAADILSGTRVDNLRSLRSKMMTAQALHYEIRDEMDDAHWAPPASLGSWVKALDVL